MRARCIIAPFCTLALAAGALAEPRDGATFTNLNSDQISGSPGGGSFAQTANYTARFVHISGTLNSLIPGTFGREATIRLAAGGANVPPPAISIAPSQSNSFTTENVDVFLRLPQLTSANAGALWQILTFETLDDGAGPDARWSTLTIALNDGPPRAANGLVANLGPVTGSLSYSLTVHAGDTKWIKFEILSDVNSGAGTYFDIDTEGSSLFDGPTPSNDSEIALYNDDGLLVGHDDDSGSVFLSQLTYGAGTRPAVGNSALYDGRNGALPAGVYYLRVGGYNASIPARVGWDYPNTGSFQAGTIRVNLRTNAGQPVFCAPDFNKSGTLEVQDIFDFLNSWFGGCP